MGWGGKAKKKRKEKLVYAKTSKTKRQSKRNRKYVLKLSLIIENKKT